MVADVLHSYTVVAVSLVHIVDFHRDSTSVSLPRLSVSTALHMLTYDVCLLVLI